MRLLLALAFVLIAVPADAACRIEPRATVPVTLARGLPVLELLVDGKPASFVLDTGAERTVIAHDAVRTLGLARDEWVSSSVRGVGGVIENTANARLRSFSLGGIELRRRSLNPVLSITVAPLPWSGAAGQPIAGVLGADYLSPHDLDLDIQGGTLTLMTTEGCGAAAPPWPPAHVSVALDRPIGTVLLAPVGIEGRTLMAALDTGASISFVSGRGSARLGPLPQAPSEAGEARGIGRAAVPLRTRSIGELRVGAAVFRDVTLAFGTPAGGFPFDMLLGADVLGRRRVLISYATNRLLIAEP